MIYTRPFFYKLCSAERNIVISRASGFKDRQNQADVLKFDVVRAMVFPLPGSVIMDMVVTKVLFSLLRNSRVM